MTRPESSPPAVIAYLVLAIWLAAVIAGAWFFGIAHHP